MEVPYASSKYIFLVSQYQNIGVPRSICSSKEPSLCRSAKSATPTRPWISQYSTSSLKRKRRRKNRMSAWTTITLSTSPIGQSRPRETRPRPTAIEMFSIIALIWLKWLLANLNYLL